MSEIIKQQHGWKWLGWLYILQLCGNYVTVNPLWHQPYNFILFTFVIVRERYLHFFRIWRRIFTTRQSIMQNFVIIYEKVRQWDTIRYCVIHYYMSIFASATFNGCRSLGLIDRMCSLLAPHGCNIFIAGTNRMVIIRKYQWPIEKIQWLNEDIHWHVTCCAVKWAIRWKNT